MREPKPITVLLHKFILISGSLFSCPTDNWIKGSQCGQGYMGFCLNYMCLCMFSFVSNQSRVCLHHHGYEKNSECYVSGRKSHCWQTMIVWPPSLCEMHAALKTLHWSSCLEVSSNMLSCMILRLLLIM